MRVCDLVSTLTLLRTDRFLPAYQDILNIFLDMRHVDYHPAQPAEVGQVRPGYPILLSCIRTLWPILDLNSQLKSLLRS